MEPTTLALLVLAALLVGVGVAVNSLLPTGQG